jgi:hypothetical protein
MEISRLLAAINEADLLEASIQNINGVDTFVLRTRRQLRNLGYVTGADQFRGLTCEITALSAPLSAITVIHGLDG